MSSWRVDVADCLQWLSVLTDGAANCIVTSPPYWGLRDYGVAGQLGLEPTPEDYVANMVAVFRDARRVLAEDGTLWVNVGDSFASGGRDGHGTRVGYKQQTNRGMNGENDSPRPPQPEGLKEKDLVGIPWRLAFALQADGWYLRSDIIWHKPNPMPESVRDRPTSAHEHVFLLAKSARYWYDADAVAEPCAEGTASRLAQSSLDTQEGGFKTERYAANHPGKKNRDRRPADILRHMRDTGISTRNLRNVWTIPTKPFSEAHFATYPEALVEPCVKAGCPPGGVVLDPFTGSGTTGAVAVRLGRKFLGCELNPQYAAMARRRIGKAQPPLFPPGEDRRQHEQRTLPGTDTEAP